MANVTKYQTSRGETRYRVRYRKPDGTQTDKRGFRRKIDAENWAAEHVTIAKATNSYIDPQAGKATVEALWPSWIAAKKVKCKVSYIDSLEREWNHRVEPMWGSRELVSVTHSEVQEWVAALTAAGSSATVVLRAEGILSGLCKQAVRDRLIGSNPCDELELPRKHPEGAPVSEHGRTAMPGGSVGLAQTHCAGPGLDRHTLGRARGFAGQGR